MCAHLGKVQHILWERVKLALCKQLSSFNEPAWHELSKRLVGCVILLSMHQKNLAFELEHVRLRQQPRHPSIWASKVLGKLFRDPVSLQGNVYGNSFSVVAILGPGALIIYHIHTPGTGAGTQLWISKELPQGF